MPRGRPIAPLELNDEQQSELTSISRSRSLPSSLVQRAKIILACAEGTSNVAVAARMSLSNATVGKWRKRYRERGLAGLHDELRPGRARTYDDERVAEVINAALQTKPADRTQWVRSMAEHSGVSKSTVQRWFTMFGLQPHRQRYFKLSNDPFFIEKVRDIVGLYLNPPEHAVVLCWTRRARGACARSRYCPWASGMSKGSATVDVVCGPGREQRHGADPLQAASSSSGVPVVPGHIEANVPAALDVHLIVDNYATHKHGRVKAWLAKRPRYHVHYTPTYATWINQVERWFGIITERAIRRGSFTSVKELVSRIESFVEQYNAQATPFVWTATAQSILAKVERLCSYI